ncbi:hypothetical protein [Flavobacterium faecale]|uniref:hypothetical protein n=1 Tax=Flavobacterium faecale TaxID=1355330 RepID=UPI003AAD065D
MLQLIRNKKSKKEILVNILTRTSNRPIGFYNCRQSIEKQTYKKIKHYVSYDNEEDIVYLDCTGVVKIKVEQYKGEVLVNPEGYLHAPYNLYCNELLNNVEDGWIMFLDDDDHLLHNKVIAEIVSEIKKTNEETLFIWQMRYPNGNVLPKHTHFISRKIEIGNIDTTCFIFHSKYKNHIKWDQWKASDYRVINALYNIIPNKKWLERVYIQKNNLGDYGNRNDISQNITNQYLFRKNIFWFLIPKYHLQINSIYIFQKKTYLQYWKRAKRKIKNLFKINK